MSNNTSSQSLKTAGLWIALAAALLAAAAVYGWGLFDGPRRRSPAELAEAALSDRDPAERERAAAELAGWRKAAQGEMRRVLQQSDSPGVRASVIQGLADGYDYQSMEPMFDALDDPSPVVRARAGRAVERMLGWVHGYRADLPAARRAEVIAAMRRTWEEMQTNSAMQQHLAGEAAR